MQWLWSASQDIFQSLPKSITKGIVRRFLQQWWHGVNRKETWGICAIMVTKA